MPVHFAELDVRNREQFKKVVEELPKGFSDVDILVNNAGLALTYDTIESASVVCPDCFGFISF